METIKISEKFFYETLKAIPEDAHKGTLGTLSIIAGSECYRGAAALCTGAALKTGTGIVRLVSVEKAVFCTAARHPTCTFLPINADENGMMSYNSFVTKSEILRFSSALLCGCGLGQSKDTKNIVLNIFSLGKPTVLDADALNVISSFCSPEVLKAAASAAPVIVTPHIGEMSRLSGKSIAHIKSERAESAKEFSDKYGCITVLKDDITYIAVPGGDVYESALGNAGLAKGGSGDVLAGFIGGFLAQNYTAEKAALLGNILHGLCASLCARDHGIRAMLPDQLENYASRVFTKNNCISI